MRLAGESNTCPLAADPPSTTRLNHYFILTCDRAFQNFDTLHWEDTTEIKGTDILKSTVAGEYRVVVKVRHRWRISSKRTGVRFSGKAIFNFFFIFRLYLHDLIARKTILASLLNILLWNTLHLITVKQQARPEQRL